MSATLQANRLGAQAPMARNIRSAGAPPLIMGGLSALYMDAIFWYGSLALFDGTGLNTVTANIPIQSDAHFMCVMAMVDNSAVINTSANTAVPTILQGGGTVILQDGASQRNLNNIALPVSTFFGNGREPYVWPFTHVFRANGFIGVQVAGAAASMANQTLRFTFGGIKIPIGSRPDLGL